MLSSKLFNSEVITVATEWICKVMQNACGMVAEKFTLPRITFKYSKKPSPLLSTNI